MMLPLLLLALQQPTPGADTGAGRPCLLEVDSIGRQGNQQGLAGGVQNFFAGGGVFAHCRASTTSLYADSAAWYGAANRLNLIGHVHIRDTAMTLDAETVDYFRQQERLDAHTNVVAVNRANGSVLRGPNLTYWRAATGIRDTVEMFATQRPVIEYRGAGVPDTAEPYTIIADRVRFKGNDRMWTGGASTIDRSDFGAQADSMTLDQTAGLGVLIGRPKVQGKGPQSYTLTGTRIELGLRDREVRLVKALGDGTATSADWHLTADTIHLVVDHRKLQEAFAWGTQQRPHAISALQDISADSLALDVPDQVLTEGRGFGHAFSASKRDSVVPDLALECTGDGNNCLIRCLGLAMNCIAGDTLTAHWAPETDSAGVAHSRIRHVVARGSARAVTHQYPRDTALAVTLDYSRGKTIDLVLKQARVDRITVGGRADGVHLEPRPPAADTTAQKDST
jgi:hypothetical protein